MSNIEPTEEQREAVRAIAEKEGARVQMWHLDEIARLLAEREAKLREKMERLHRAVVDTVCAAQDAENDTLRARVAELEAEASNLRASVALVCIERDELEDSEAKHLARIADLEKERDDMDARAGMYSMHLGEAMEREAQHLADIRALMAPAEDIADNDGDTDAFEWGIKEYLDTVKRLAHYDATDAEGGEG